MSETITPRQLLHLLQTYVSHDTVSTEIHRAAACRIQRLEAAIDKAIDELGSHFTGDASNWVAVAESYQRIIDAL